MSADLANFYQLLILTILLALKQSPQSLLSVKTTKKRDGQSSRRAAN